MNKLYAGIEAGGTKTICGIGDKNGNLLYSAKFDTNNPYITLSKVVEFFKNFKFHSLGIACFGPLYLKKKHIKHGTIMDSSPKIEWRNFNLLKFFKRSFPKVIIKIDTDVNAAAIAEFKFGDKHIIDNLLYLTIGTGIGGGIIANKKLVYGLIHPEMGHIFVKKHEKDVKNFNGICPIHKNCLEGMASGPAINNRWKVKHCSLLNKKHTAWDLEAYYLAQGLIQYILILSPQKIILGGGVMQQKHLFSKIRLIINNYLGNYLDTEFLNNKIDNFIIPPKLGENSGIIGAIYLGSL